VKIATITRGIRDKVRDLAFRLQSAVEANRTWDGIESVERELMEIITEEASRLADTKRRSATYFESLPSPPERDGTTPSRYASITITRPQHSRVAAAAAERDQPMSRIVGELIDGNL
jgi:hypothetical protein